MRMHLKQTIKLIGSKFRCPSKLENEKMKKKLILELRLLFYVLGLEIVNCCYFALIYELCGGGNNRTIHCLKHSSLSDSENPAEKNNPVPLRYQR